MNTKNSKKIISTTVFAAIIVILMLAISTAPASAQIDPEDKAKAIEDGLDWLAAQQDSDGAWNPDYWPVGSTAFAVLKFAHHAKFTLDPPMDPFDPTYEYSDNIVEGLNYIFNHSYYIDIDKQWNGNDLLDPDVNIVNGKGIYFMSPGTGTNNRPLYETGIVMMALEASCHKGRIVEYGNHAGLDYITVMMDTVDYIAWAQNDWPNAGRGGWRYGAFDNGTITGPGWGGPYSDNSVSQWPVLGLMSATAWLGPTNPTWVKTELNHWLVYSQNANGCFGYDSSTGGGVVAMTASGLTQLTYCGVATDDPRWAAARQCICENWNIGDLYTMYGVMKAAMTAQPEVIWWYNCTSGTHEWQPEYDAWLIAKQEDDGSWPAQFGNTGVLSTEWALLILQKVVPPEPQNQLWHEIEDELDALIDDVSAADMPNIIKQRLLDKLEYAKALRDNAKIVCHEDNFDAATKKLGVAKSQVGSFASMVRITRRISAADKASFLADAASITGKIDALIEYIETEHKC